MGVDAELLAIKGKFFYDRQYNLIPRDIDYLLEDELLYTGLKKQEFLSYLDKVIKCHKKDKDIDEDELHSRLNWCARIRAFVETFEDDYIFTSKLI